MLGITGTPGTGKKSVAPIVAERLGTRCLSLSELARSYGLVSKSGAVDTRKLRARLEHNLTGEEVVYGHLLPYAVPPSAVSKVVVLRCEPGVLKQRLRLRGYRLPKIVENVEAELIGIVSADSFDTYGRGRTWEVDTTSRPPGDVASALVEIVVSEPRRAPRIDWTLDYDSGAKLRLLLSTAE